MFRGFLLALLRLNLVNHPLRRAFRDRVFHKAYDDLFVAKFDFQRGLKKRKGLFQLGLEFPELSLCLALASLEAPDFL